MRIKVINRTSVRLKVYVKEVRVSDTVLENRDFTVDTIYSSPDYIEIEIEEA